MRRILWLALVPLALGACASDSTGSGTAPSPGADGAERAAYIAKADAACAAFPAQHPELAASMEKIDGITLANQREFDTLADHFELVHEVASEFAETFESIEPPEADRAAIDELNAENQTALDLLPKIVHELRNGTNPTALGQQYGEAIARADQLAADYGFQSCARVSAGLQ
jgi:hypothetical protein